MRRALLDIGFDDRAYGHAKAGDKVAVLNAFAKYDRETWFRPEVQAWQLALDTFASMFGPYLADCRPYSYLETRHHMKGSTATGFPENVTGVQVGEDLFPCKKKHHALLNDEVLDAVVSELDLLVARNDPSIWAEKALTRWNVWNAIAKQELLPGAKNEYTRSAEGILMPPKVRIIIYPSLPLAYMENSYVGPVEAAYIRASMDPRFGSMIGHSPAYGRMFEIIAEKARRPGWIVTTSDYTAYDSTQDDEFIKAEHDLILRNLPGDEDGMRHRNALRWVQHCQRNANVILPNGQVFSKHGTQNSGARDTSGGNTRRNFLAILYCFYVAHPEATSADFFENVKLYLMGDDLLAFVHPDWIEGFGVDDRARNCFEAFGIQTKTRERDSTSWENHTFIGFSFIERVDEFGKTCIVPAFSAQKVMASAVYPQEKEKDPKLKYGRLMSLAALSVFSDEDEPKSLYFKLREQAFSYALQAGINGLVPPFPTYEELYNMWTGHETFATERRVVCVVGHPAELLDGAPIGFEPVVELQSRKRKNSAPARGKRKIAKLAGASDVSVDVDWSHFLEGPYLPELHGVEPVPITDFFFEATCAGNDVLAPWAPDTFFANGAGGAHKDSMQHQVRYPIPFNGRPQAQLGAIAANHVEADLEKLEIENAAGLKPGAVPGVEFDGPDALRTTADDTPLTTGVADFEGASGSVPVGTEEALYEHSMVETDIKDQRSFARDAEKLGIDPSNVPLLSALINPCSDLPISPDVKGWPRAGSHGQSVMSVQRRTKIIGPPSKGAKAEDTWDAQIVIGVPTAVTTPFSVARFDEPIAGSFYPWKETTLSPPTLTAPLQTMGTVTIAADWSTNSVGDPTGLWVHEDPAKTLNASGTAYCMGVSPLEYDTTNISTPLAPVGLTDDSAALAADGFAVLGCGVVVEHIGPVIGKGGAVFGARTADRVAPLRASSATGVPATGQPWQLTEYERTATVPSMLSDLTKIPWCSRGKASDGAYMVSVAHSEPQFEIPTGIGSAVTSTVTPIGRDLSAGRNSFTAFIPKLTDSGGGSFGIGGLKSRLSNNVCRFVGLGQDARLAVSIVFYVERLGSYVDNFGQSVSHRAPTPDPWFDRILRQSLSVMPGFSPADSNFFGSAFRGVVKALAPKVMEHVAPKLKGAAKGAGPVLELVENFIGGDRKSVV